MIRILTTISTFKPSGGFIASLSHRLGHMARMTRDVRSLDTLPRERLDDMGIPPRSDANCRSSAEHGSIPRGPMW